jgi:hypothetical protein
MPRHHCSRIGAVLAAILWTTALPYGQAPPADPAAALKQSLAANQAVLRQYSWVETTTISLKGEVKKQEQKQCYYGADGKVQKTPIPGAAAAPQQSAQSGRGGGGGRSGRMKERIVENKVEELTEYMQKAAALVQDYVPPEAAKIQAAQAAGHVSMKPASGTVTRLTAADYLKPGDTLAIGIDTASKQLTEYSVNSYVEKPKDDDLALNVTFGRLQDGTSYPQQIVLDVKAKNVQVKVVNSGYKKAP